MSYLVRRGDRIKELRNKRRWGQKELASAAGLCVSTVQKAERAKPQTGKEWMAQLDSLIGLANALTDGDLTAFCARVEAEEDCDPPPDATPDGLNAPFVEVVRLVGGIHPDVEGFRLLYERWSRDNRDAAPFEEIAEWLARAERFGGIAPGWAGFLLAAKLGWEVVGFLCFDLHMESGNLFLRDFVADEANRIAAQFARPALFREATRLLRAESRRVARILFETEADTDAVGSSVTRIYAAWWGRELAGCPTTARKIPVEGGRGDFRAMECVSVVEPDEPLTDERAREIRRFASQWRQARCVFPMCDRNA